MRGNDDKGASERLKSNPFKIGLGKLDSGNETGEGERGKFFVIRADSVGRVLLIEGRRVLVDVIKSLCLFLSSYSLLLTQTLPGALYHVRSRVSKVCKA